MGPIDPQLPLGSQMVAAKDIIAAVEDAIQKVEASPETYPFHAFLMGGLTAIMVQEARSALSSTEDLLEPALLSNPDRLGQEVTQLKELLRGPLIEVPQSHAALFSANSAAAAGLPVQIADPRSDQWRMLWRLWTRYFALGNSKSVYESASASQIFDRFNNTNDDQ